MRRRIVLGGLAALALGACADDEAPAPPAPPPAPAEPARVAVARVATLELGRTRTGFVLVAFGEAEGLGWRLPQLRPISPTPDAEGLIVFELVAIPPATPGPGVQRIRADTPLASEALRGAQGVRVVARQGSVSARL